MTKDEALRLEPVKLRRGDILRCIETDELCTVWATSTSGKTLVKWGGNDFTDYTAEQIGELFWLEPTAKDEPVAWGMEQPDGEILDVISPEEHARLEGGYTVPLYRQRTWVGLTEAQCGVLWKVDMTPFDYYQAIEAKLKEKNT
jgi:hypothetical protein